VYVDFFERDGELLTDTLTLANVFGKSHRHVLEKMNKIQCSQRFWRSNFRPREYIDSRGKEQPLVEMGKNGMMFLVLSFTGKKVDYVREAYIEQFH
jgi:Rha family phage regulatory protein